MLASEFISAVRAEGKIPSDIADASILLAGDREIAGHLVPLIRQTHQEYFVAEATAEAYGGRVALPARAVAGSVRHVQRLDGSRGIPLPQRALEDDGTSSGGVAQGWHFDGGGIVLLPRGASGTLRLRYFLRPSKLVLETDTSSCRSISSAAQASGGWALTLSGAAPTGPYDVVSAGPAHECVAIGISSSTAIASTEVLSSFSSLALPGYLVKAGFTPYIQVPEELSTALIHHTAAIVLRALGYLQEATAQGKQADIALGLGQGLLVPRSEGNPRRLVGGLRRALGMRGSR
jgi:hypothetical protein